MICAARIAGQFPYFIYLYGASVCAYRNAFVHISSELQSVHCVPKEVFQMSRFSLVYVYV